MGQKRPSAMQRRSREVGPVNPFPCAPGRNRLSVDNGGMTDASAGVAQFALLGF
jgi:hypothetical protein